MLLLQGRPIEDGQLPPPLEDAGDLFGASDEALIYIYIYIYIYTAVLFDGGDNRHVQQAAFLRHCTLHAFHYPCTQAPTLVAQAEVPAKVEEEENVEVPMASSATQVACGDNRA